ncbi:baseplate J/gp47 family protein [Psychrobacillus sp. NPDC093180]|uniref:baseplate J/gp47 family protein n=1 Tax=Psychrobacillus sp. NPDC093180 TaxID=3364489 RepID=UPI00382A83A2
METTKEIHDRMINNISDDFDKSTGEFIWDVTNAGAKEFEKQQKEIQVVESKMDIENLSGDDLSRFVYQRTGIKRKLATKAVTTVLISGSEGATISAGDLVGTDTLNFVVLEDAVIPSSGQVIVFVSSELYGNVGNVPAHSINRFPITITGLVDVYNPEQVTNGYEAESDSELRGRYYDKLQRPGKAGNIYHYEEWAKEVVGVGGARCFPLWNGPLTVKVVIIDSNKQPASEELVQNVFDYIESQRPFGAILTVVSAIGKPIDVTVTLSLVNGYTEDAAEENIKANLESYLKELAFSSSSVSYAKTGSHILDSEGVLDYQNLLVNNGTANISIGEDEIAIVGNISSI